MKTNAIHEKAARIRLLILDVDGVLTEGSIVFDSQGNELKFFHVRDGHGIKMLIRTGVEVAIITGRESPVVSRRAEELGIRTVRQKCYDKIAAFDEILRIFGMTPEQTACMGDDIVDIPLLRRAGLAVAVADAAEEVKQYADFVTVMSGGRGAVREVCECILKAGGSWDNLLDEIRNA